MDKWAILKKCVCGRERSKKDNHHNWQLHTNACLRKRSKTPGVDVFFASKKQKMDQDQRDATSAGNASFQSTTVDNCDGDGAVGVSKDDEAYKTGCRDVCERNGDGECGLNFEQQASSELSEPGGFPDSAQEGSGVDEACGNGDVPCGTNSDTTGASGGGGTGMSSAHCSDPEPLDVCAICMPEDDQTTKMVTDGDGSDSVSGETVDNTANISVIGTVTKTGGMGGGSGGGAGGGAAEVGGGDGNEPCCTSEAFLNKDPAEFAKIKTFTPELKNKILKVGPCQPTENELENCEFPKDSQGRRCHSAWYCRRLNDGSIANREWLSYSVSTNRIFCLDCMLFCKNPQKSWTSTGFQTWATGTFSILAHETSEKHVRATVDRRIYETAIPVLPAVKGMKAEQVARNRLVVKQLIDITLFLGRHCLAFRGHRESVQSQLRGNFKDLAALLGEYSPTMASYLSSLYSNKKNRLSFLSWRRQNELIDDICKFIRKTFCQKIRDAKMFSTSIDTSFDKSRKEQVSIIVRYVDEETGEIHERLLAVRESPRTTGKALSEVFDQVCKDNDLDWVSELVSQSHDGASNMSGEYIGLQALIQAKNPRAIYVWCWAHRLNLIVVDAVGCCTDAMDLFGNLEKLFAFINRSKCRVSMFSENQKKHNLKKMKKEGQLRRLKRVSTTRWMSHYHALLVVLKTFDALMETLEQIRTTEGPSDNEAGATAGGLIRYFCSQRFSYTATAFAKIFEILDPFTKSLQSPDIDLLSAAVLLEENLLLITSLREQFEDVISRAQTFMDSSNTEFQQLPPPKRIRKRKKMPGEKANDEPISDPKRAFEVNTFYVAIDTVISQLNERFRGHSDITLGLLKDLSLISRKRIGEVCLNPDCMPKDAFNVFCSIYEKYVNANEVRKEFLTFASCFENLEKTLELPRSLHSETKTNSFEDEQNDLDDSELESDCEHEVEHFGLNTGSDNDENENLDNEDEDVNSQCTDAETVSAFEGAELTPCESEKRKDYRYSNVGSLPLIFKLFCKAKLRTVFPNLHALLKIAVTLSLTSVSTERSFSKLKRVKTDLRSTMGGDRLEGLLIIACEYDIPLDYEKIIDMFASRSSILMKNLM